MAVVVGAYAYEPVSSAGGGGKFGGGAGSCLTPQQSNTGTDAALRRASWPLQCELPRLGSVELNGEENLIRFDLLHSSLFVVYCLKGSSAAEVF